MYKVVMILVFGFSMLLSNELELEVHNKYSNGYRILIDCNIKDEVGISDARVYFKDAKQKIYHLFAPMSCKGESCRGTIPVPSKLTKSIEYIILYQNNSGEVYNSKEFKMNSAEMIELPNWQVFSQERLELKTELVNIPKQLYGFDDKVKIVSVDDENKLGFKAGIISQEMVGLESQTDVFGNYMGVVAQREKEVESDGFFSAPSTVVIIMFILFLL